MTASHMSGVRLNIHDYDDPIILVRPLFVVEQKYGEFGQLLPTHSPDGVEISSVEILVMNQEGVGVYLQLSHEIFMELYEKMSGVVPDGQDMEVSSSADN